MGQVHVAPLGKRPFLDNPYPFPDNPCPAPLESNSPAQPAPLGPYLEANYTEIAETVRFYFSNPLLVKCGDKAFDESGLALADPVDSL